MGEGIGKAREMVREREESEERYLSLGYSAMITNPQGTLFFFFLLLFAFTLIVISIYDF